jgi:hypothetical protein
VARLVWRHCLKQTPHKILLHCGVTLFVVVVVEEMTLRGRVKRVRVSEEGEGRREGKRGLGGRRERNGEET